MIEVSENTKPSYKKPDWLRVKLPTGENYKRVRNLVDKHTLHTICESGNCPNMGECWGRGTATFMILGNICTRSCSFCAVATGKPIGVDQTEPERVADSVKKMGVKHCVITSVDRDDLKDGGSTIWAKTVNAIRKTSPGTTLETLIPDFQANWENLNRVLDTKPEVVSHNVETVKRLTKGVRIQAKYERSLEVIKRIDEFDLVAKSGIMLGLGENQDDIYEAMDDLLAAGCDVLTLGQYLQPTRKHHEVIEFIHPDTFAHYKEIGLVKGFKYVESGPLVRSSYHAERHVIKKHA
ncbi:MAG: lipoyl synthase [Bacteroidia bacterium]|nr:lipoyl synthase [Bacteroidia bacterium]